MAAKWIDLLDPTAEELRSQCPRELEESLIGSLQRVQVDEDDVADEVGSISASAEALRLTAAAPQLTYVLLTPFLGAERAAETALSSPELAAAAPADVTTEA